MLQGASKKYLYIVSIVHHSLPATLMDPYIDNT